MTDFQTFGEIREGADVYGSGGDKVGSIVALRPNYIVVEKGFFFPTDYYIPRTAIASVQSGKVYLSVTRDAALNQGWDAIPVDFDAAATERVVEPVAVANANLTEAERARLARGGRETLAEGETIAIPVHEEELVATKHRGEIGDVRVEKIVTSEQETLDVPVTEERVRIERRVVDRPVTAADTDLFEDEVIDVPVYGEDVEVTKRVRVAEEVDIAKEAVQRTEHVTDTVRREDVRITGDNVDATTGEIIDADRIDVDRNRSAGI
ncbi:MAG: DUF2382 domain-containing protein [Thermomicrobiales bacterium]|nr:DUF2382 domain-containing protein [Thermomicrobiales bacterium]